MEDLVRVLADPTSGLLVAAKTSDSSLLHFHLSTLSAKLKDVLAFLHTQVKTSCVDYCYFKNV